VAVFTLEKIKILPREKERGKKSNKNTNFSALLLGCMWTSGAGRWGQEESDKALKGNKLNCQKGAGKKHLQEGIYERIVILFDCEREREGSRGNRGCPGSLQDPNRSRSNFLWAKKGETGNFVGREREQDGGLIGSRLEK